MQLSLEGKRALITGAAAGIGAAMARLFAEAGARVHICDVDTAALHAFSSKNPGIGTSVTDVSDDDAVGALVDDATRAMGGLDILVNNAGIAGPTARVEDMAVADWKKTLA